MRAIWSSKADKRVILRPVGVLAICLPAANVTGSLRCTLQGQVDEQNRGDKVGKNRKGGGEGGEMTREQK